MAYGSAIADKSLFITTGLMRDLSATLNQVLEFRHLLWLSASRRNTEGFLWQRE